jgi:2-polyprenyl-3-methyl-5-hydroxy-6-metoxy-1,4-benzoquinol methylase
MIDHTNLEDYADPILYDLENSDFEPDGPFCLSLAQQLGGRVLELGCGTGRVTIPLARQGIKITGLDIVPEMIACAQRKAGNLPIEWVEADVRDFHLERQFNLICAPGCVFEHLLERKDQEAMLACVHKHLAREGVFVIATRFPHPDFMVEVQEEQHWYSYIAEDRGKVTVAGTDHYDPVRQIKYETAYRRWYGDDGQEVTKRARLALRFIFPQEMETLLHYNGFKVVDRYGNWDSSPLMGDSRLIIHVCQKRI